MKRRERQLFRRLGRGAFGLQVMLAMFMLLVGGGPKAWADNDPGGGTYSFGNNGGISCTNYFKTNRAFSYTNGVFYWEFAFNAMPNQSYKNNGKISLLTKDGKWHVVAEWYKEAYATKFSFDSKDDAWGSVLVSSHNLYTNSPNMTIQVIPSKRFFDDGVKRIKMEYSNEEYIHYIHEFAYQGDIRYEKDIDTSICTESSPLPKLSIGWNNNGQIEFKASNYEDKTNKTYTDNANGIKATVYKQDYAITRIYTNLASNSYASKVVNYPTENGTKRSDGNLDLTGGFWDVDYGTYTLPVVVSYSAKSDVQLVFTEGKDKEYRYFIEQPTIRELIKPFTSPVSVNVEFNKWKKKNTISWTARQKAEYYDDDVKKETDCRTDGKWYVIRYEKGKAATDYKLLGSLDGNASKLELTDSDLEFDKEYYYRVVFLPNVLESGYNKKLASLPGHSKDADYYPLYKEKLVSTKLEMPIELKQDRTYDQAVRLVWDYCVEPSGQNWTIEYNSGNGWFVLDDKMQVDSGRSRASFDADGTVCDKIQYRVKTKWMDRDFYSNVIEGTLPAGSYISDVTATTGTEESSVKIKWEVARPDKNNSLTFKVKRRPIGTEEWTTLDNNISGEKREFVDQRPLAGTYYEYTVEAYGNNCPGQVALTDAVITPGFSQARGTITGHVAFGSGTAVEGVRVNLVKASADEGNDQAQYLSREISGKGKGLQWQAGREKYEKLFSGTQAFTTQLWAKPLSDGDAKMGLLTLPGVIELGMKRIDDTSDYTLQLPDDDYMLIDNAADWETFVKAVNGGHTNLNATLTTDVDASAVKEMAGNSSENAYKGTFDGNGHILTVNYNTTEQVTAPFRYAAGATIKNLRVEGTLASSAKNVAGLVGFCLSGTNRIDSCRVSATIDCSIDGDATNGGFVAHVAGSTTLNISDCLFDGKFTGDKCYANGGFVGFNEGNTTIKNCLYNGSYSTKESGNRTFSRTRYADKITLADCYYTKAMDDGDPKQGTSAEGMESSDLLTALGSSWKVFSETLLPVMKTDVSPTIPRKDYTLTTVDKRPGTSNDTTAVYQLYAVDLSTATPKVTEFPGLTFSGQDFTHVAAVYDGKSKWKFYVGSDTLLVDSINASGTGWKTYVRTMSIGGDGRESGSAYTGHVDDVRLWNRALTRKELDGNYTRILGGTENGLILYWPLDEGENVKSYAFDIARQDNIYQLNHPEVGVNALPSKSVPQRLKLYGLTDDKGNYIIKGIPFQQGGTNYALTPELGIHSFSPGTRSMFVSPTSLTANNIDFEDVSSFPMTGKVYYAGTNIPVEGVQFYVDGNLQSKDGKTVETDASGQYSLSVPIGWHYVEAKLPYHDMVDGGRFPLKEKWNFTRAVQHDFADSTLVNFVGRVGGGEVNDTLAVGFGKSVNNIGCATITLGLTNESLSFNCEDDFRTRSAVVRTWESDTTSINSKAWTGIKTADTDSTMYIQIRTDSVTGEFSALLPPLKYVTRSIEILSNPGIEFNNMPQIDLTSVPKEATDSMLIDSEWKKYKYNTKVVRTYFAEPKLEITEQGNAKGAFGLKELKDYVIDYGTHKDTITIGDLWKDMNGKVSYLMGYPIYQMEDSAYYDLHGYEEYVNHDGKEDKSQIIPLNGLVVTIMNEMSSDQKVIAFVDNPETGKKPGEIYEPKSNELQLGSDGRATYKWHVGAPNIVSPYTRHLSMTFKRKDRTYNGPQLDAVVLGFLLTGNNFVTKGPDQVKFVLRDPPGSKSKTTLKRGEITVEETLTGSSAYTNNDFIVNNQWGTEVNTAFGFGVMTISNSQSKVQVDVGLKSKWETTSTHEHLETTTITEAISTSAGSLYVGSVGDVYVGNSTNLLVGSCRTLGISRKDAESDFTFKLDDNLTVGKEIATSFMYTQYELETVMIPKWEDLRKAFLVQVADEATANAFVNTEKQSVYLSWVKPDNANYGRTGYYRRVRPLNYPKDKDEIDSVLLFTQTIDKWKNIIAQNEEDKVKSMATRDSKKGWVNYSIDGGSTYTYTDRFDKTDIDREKENWTVGDVIGGHTTLAISFSLYWRAVLNANHESGGGEISGSGSNTESYTEWEYTLCDGNRDTDLSIDKYISQKKNFGPVFSLFGGQTYNPYEAQEFTKYYEPGTPLGNGSVQMEQPNLGIGVGDQNPAKNVTITDIPAGGEANVKLHCTNMANVHQGVNFSYDLFIMEETNDNGLEILMDGVPVNGRSVYLNQSQTTTKVLTIRQTDQSILDYEGIKIRFCSQYQPAKIYDEVTLNAHFVPSSSPVTLAIKEPVVNSTNKAGKLAMKITNFNRQFKNLKNVGVQYRFTGSTQWTDLYTWWVTPEDTTGMSKASHDLLARTGDISYSADMLSNISYPEGQYEFRAFTTTPYGNDDVQVYSDIVTVTKDMTRPINLFTPAPANGILGYGDQLAIEFNEDIVPGYVSDNNIIVTAKLNDEQVNHEVALRLMPFGEAPRTVNPVFLQGDFSIDFWLYLRYGGTILSLGKTDSTFALNVRDDGYVVATVGGTQHVSDKPMPKDEWTFVALSYKASTMTFDMEASADQAGNVMLFENRPVAMEDLEAFSYTDDYHLYLGGIDADIHSLSLYNIYRDVHLATATKDKAKDSYVYGLANHWPFDEGHGFMAADKRHTHDFSVPDRWLLENVNYGLRIDDNEGAKIDITQISTMPGDSYAIELWHQISDYDGKDVVFETMTPNQDIDDQKHNKLRLHYDGKKNLILNYDKDSIMVASVEDFPEVMDWRHLALNVVRGQAASFYLNGQRTAVIAETDVPPLEGTVLAVSKDAKNSWVDELRIWHAALSESRLQQNMYNTIDTADVYSRGLVAYYPFEKTGKDNGIPTKVQTLENLAHSSVLSGFPAEIDTTHATFSRYAPPLKNAPDETPIKTTPVASERKLIINLSGENSRLRRIEGTTLNITVDQIRDLHGNTSLPIRWTAYVQQNTLKWTRDSVNVIKKYGDDYTFDVEIENKSGNTEYYTLYNMPQWLSLVDSERSDDVSPLRTKTLRFRVNPLTPVGNYDVTIGLQGNNGIQEPLRVVMKVRGERPQWAVDPTKYQHQMSIVGQVYINGILMENAESMVAAFIGGECRGVASPEKVRGAAYVAMTVYGKDTRTADRGKALTFRIWDATQGVAYTDAQIAVDGSPIDIVFGQDKLIGNFDHPAIWTKSENVEQLIPVHLNWNWIAFGVVPKSPYLDHIFADYADWQLLIKDRTLFSDYNGAEWNGTLQPVANAMYKLRIDRLPTTKKEAPNSLLAVSGRQLKENAERAVTLSKGWNWIAYTPLTTMTVNEALAAANPQTGDIVKSQTAVAVYGPYGWEGSLKALEGGHGYLYFTNDSTGKSFLYPAASSASAKARMAAPRRAAEEDELRIFHPVELGLYPSNMTMVIRLMDGTAPVDTAEVGAFIGDECRGAVRASSRSLYYLVISGEGAGQPMTLRSCIDGQIIDIDTSLMYVSDDNIGTSWEPYVIDLNEMRTGISTIAAADDDDDDWWSIQGFKLDRKPTQPGVYIHHGKKVLIKLKK